MTEEEHGSEGLDISDRWTESSRGVCTYEPVKNACRVLLTGVTLNFCYVRMLKARGKSLLSRKASHFHKFRNKCV